jgi:hypothetical protein
MAGYTGTHNTLLTNYHQFVLNRVPTMAYFCQSVNLPGIGMGSVEQPTIFGLPVNVPSGAIRFEDFSITFKVDENLKNWLEIYNWIRGNGNLGEDCTPALPYPNKVDSGGTLLITNSSYKPKLRVNFKHLWPKSLSGIVFSTALPDSVEAVATAVFAYTSHSVERLASP